MPKAIGYVRVSTVGQADDGVSLEMQEAKIRAWADLNDYEVIGIFEDAGISGTDESRPGLESALSAVKEHGCALVSYSISRVSRNSIHLMTLARDIEQMGGDLVSIQEKIDTTSAAGKMVFRMLAVLSEFERDQISERTRAAMQHMKSQGKRVGSIPYGYTLSSDGVSLDESERELEIIREIRALRREGITLRAISDELAKRGVFSRNGKPFHPQTVARIAAA